MQSVDKYKDKVEKIINIMLSNVSKFTSGIIKKIPRIPYDKIYRV